MLSDDFKNLSRDIADNAKTIDSLYNELVEAKEKILKLEDIIAGYEDTIQELTYEIVELKDNME